MSQEMKLEPKNPLEPVFFSIFFIAVACTLFFIINQIFFSNNFSFNSHSTSSISAADLGIVFQFDSVELANLPDQQEHGLMYRTSLCDKCIMLFAFSSSQVQNFWMKNTLIPLDIIFLDSNGNIVEIHENTKPNQTSETYSSNQPARFVIEGSGGLASRLGVKKGDVMNIQQLLNKSVPMQKTPQP